MTEAEVAKLKSAGIDDAIILDMQKEEASKNGQAAPQAEVKSALPEIDPNTPSQAYTQAQAAGVPTEGRSPSMAQTGAEIAGVVANNPVATGLAAAGAYGVASRLPVVGPAVQAVGNAVGNVASRVPVVGPVMEMGRNAINAAEAYSMSKNAQALSQLEHQVRQYTKAGQAVPQQLQQAVDALRGRVTGPVAPAAAPMPAPVAPAGAVPAAPVAQAAEAGVMNRAKDVVQRLALSKLAPMAANILRGANVAALATYSSDLGPKVPGTGRMRGMEINPLTGAPWTPEQIAQYEANPAVYDQQLPPPQFRR